MKSILVIGSLNMDMTLYVDRFPCIGETITSKGFLMSPGGKGSNQALAAAMLGAHVFMAGCVGNDLYADALIADLSKSGVDTSHIRRIEDINTGLATITVCDGANMIILDQGANARMTPADIDALEPLFDEVGIVILQFEIPMPTVERACVLARAHGCTLIVNPAPCQTIPRAVLENADYLIPNETEAMAILGWPCVSPQNAPEALAALRAMGVKNPVITLGDHGVAYMDGGVCRIDASCPVTAVDTTAAGDTLIGAFAYGLMNGKPTPDAVDFAQHASAVCVTRKGAHTAIPSLDDVLALKNALRKTSK